MSRIALVVGINYYKHVSSLYGCVDDAHAVKAVLERHGGGIVNFGCQLLTGTGPGDTVARAELKDQVAQLFSTAAETALFYFAGHGHIEATGGYLVASDATRGDEGLSLAEVLTLAMRRRPPTGSSFWTAATPASPGRSPDSETRLRSAKECTALPHRLEGARQTSTRRKRTGGACSRPCSGRRLSGAAANLTGHISPAASTRTSTSPSARGAAPRVQANVKEFVSLREVEPPYRRRRPAADSRVLPEPRLRVPAGPDLRARAGGT